MRAFVFLLILCNLLFLAWTQGYFGASSNPDTFRVQQQLLAEQIRVVARDELPAELARPEKAAKPAEKRVESVCLRVGDLAADEAARLEALTAEKHAAFKGVRTANPGSTSYWVFIPPLGSKQEAESKAAELKKLRVPEFFIVQESGPNNRAISLGLFSSREAAASRLEQLRSKGVRSAKVGERNGKPTSFVIELTGPETQAEALRQTLVEALPDTKLAACKTAVAAP